VAEIDLGALRKNADVIAATLGPAVGLVAVVKADAYGHGAVVCARALEKKVWGFAVSLVEEGVELRRAGVEAPIIVLGSFYGLSHRDVVAYKLTPVIGDAADLARFSRAVEDLSVSTLGVHLKVDTGMSRLGLRVDALKEFVDSMGREPRLELTGLCTHLADADSGPPATSAAQLAKLDEARAHLSAAGLRPQLTHIANSAGAWRMKSSRADLVRVGLALYGYRSSELAAWPGLTPVLSLKSRIVALRELAVGDRVSYGGKFVAERPTRIATVPIGYADGYTRRMSGCAEVLVAGKRCKVVGAITMDMCMVDVTTVTVALGDEVTLLGGDISADDLASWSGTISWEILCGISKRVPRIYTGERP
jgi:alanine racemase